MPLAERTLDRRPQPAGKPAGRRLALRALSLAGLALLALAPQGCMAVGTRVLLSDSANHELSERAYIGTRADIECLRVDANDATTFALKTLIVLDVPLSIAMDTVLLPVDAITAAVK